MIRITKQEKQKYDNSNTPRITENRELVAEVVKIEEHISKEHPEWTPALKFIFRVLQEPFVGAFASGLVPAIWQPETKLDRWLTALGFTSANMGETFTEGDLSSKLRKTQARITVRIKNGFPNVVDIQAMSEYDQKLISPDAFKKQQRPVATTTQGTTPQSAPAAEVAPAVTPIPAATNVTVPGKVTGDEIPF
jgi:hypothetical protein